jgi:drug/metabolite transporter (DMT)-like permease
VIAAYAALAASMVIVGGNVVLLKLLAAHLPTFPLLFMRTSFATLCLAPLVAPRLPAPRTLAILFMQAACGTLLYNGMMVAGLKLTGAVQAGLVLASLPAVIALGAALFLREHLRPLQWAAVVLAGVGIAALARGGGGFSLVGDALIFGAVCGEAGYALFARRAAGLLPVMQATFWMQACGAAMTAPLAIASFGQVHFTWLIAGLLLVNSLTSSVLAVILWYHGMRRVQAGIAGTFTALLPATATLMGVLVLAEPFTRGDAMGFAALFVSMVLILRPQRRPPWKRKASA